MDPVSTAAPEERNQLDVIVVGAGPAGLSAALLLGRCRRRVLVCDEKEPRNAAAHSLHGFLTRDGIRPADLLRIGREQLGAYPNVRLRQATVRDARRGHDGFRVALGDNRSLDCRKLVLATGVTDQVPEVPGLRELYGRSVFHCPYCDGWELRDQPLAAYGRGKRGLELALELTAWGEDVVLCTDGPAELTGAGQRRLGRHGIAVRTEPIRRLEGRDGVLEGIRFADGTVLSRRALFFNTGWQQRSDLPARLGCEFTPRGAVRARDLQATNVPGLFVVGDASDGVGLAIVAAAEGAKAAVAINTELLKEDLDRKETMALLAPVR